ncbi:hypothetical protein [Amycolatopsis kentuckyensis]|uniref:hypothetical protein n=1 Tax=Amycolatopsis kentuckyensis TaxID=218823 RepID=UPI003567563F
MIDDERLRVTTDHLFWVKCGHRVERHDLPDGMREQVKAADEIIPFRHDAKPLLVDIERELAARVYWRERLAD